MPDFDVSFFFFRVIRLSEIRLPDGPLHEIGDFAVGLHLHPEINVEITVKVVAEE